MNLTINNIIEKLKKSGTNSKRQVIEALENATDEQLRQLASDCYQIGFQKRKKEEERNNERN